MVRSRCARSRRIGNNSTLAAKLRYVDPTLAAQPPLAIRGARRAIDVAWYSDPHASFRAAVDAQIACSASDDFRDARQSMVEGRSPALRGK